MAASWSSKWRWHTGYSADSVEWCPVEPHRDVLVCGTYQLDKKDEQEQQSTKQKRLGRMYVFQIDQDAAEWHPVQTVDTSGILDQKWCYHTIQDRPVLAVVTSEGLLQLYQLFESNGICNLKLWQQRSIGPELLALSVDWSTNKAVSDEPMIAVSDSTGGVTLLKLEGDGLRKVGCWKSHGYEAWITAFNYWNTDVFYSGGDDCLFKSYDIRVDAAVTTNRSHEAGVTTIRSHIDQEHQLLTGSYDERVRLWDARSLKRCVADASVNGGVWRLKWHPHHSAAVLAACMYGGVRVLSVNATGVSVLCKYLEHDSIAYGADWKSDQSGVVATCSFYDCSMHIGRVNIGN